MTLWTSRTIDDADGRPAAVLLAHLSSDHVAEFEIHPVAAWGSPGGAPLFAKHTGGGMPDYIPAPADATPLVKGSVKWDGCSDFRWPELDDGSNDHICEADTIRKRARWQLAAYRFCAELLEAAGTWDLPELPSAELEPDVRAAARAACDEADRSNGSDGAVTALAALLARGPG